MNARKRMELGAERAKYIWRIREFMSDSGKESYSALARELGVTPETVRRTISGTLHSKTVLEWLRRHGVPEKYLCDPMQENR